MLCSTLLAAGVALTGPLELAQRLERGKWVLPGSGSRADLRRHVPDYEYIDEGFTERRRNSIVDQCRISAVSEADASGAPGVSLSLDFCIGDPAKTAYERPYYGVTHWNLTARIHVPGVSGGQSSPSFSAAIPSENALYITDTRSDVRTEAKIYFAGAGDAPSRLVFKQYAVGSGKILADIDCGAPVDRVARIPYALEPYSRAPNYGRRDLATGAGFPALARAVAPPGHPEVPASVGADWRTYESLAYSGAFQREVRELVDAAQIFSKVGDNSWDGVAGRARFSAMKSSGTGEVVMAFSIPVEYYDPLVAGPFFQRRRIVGHVVGNYVLHRERDSPGHWAVRRFYTLESLDKDHDRFLFDLGELKVELTDRGDARVQSRRISDGDPNRWTPLRYAGVVHGRRHIFLGSHRENPILFWFEGARCGAEVTTSEGILRRVFTKHIFSGSWDF